MGLKCELDMLLVSTALVLAVAVLLYVQICDDD